MRIVLCENGLGPCGREGHHFNVTAELREDLAARQIPLTILCHVSAAAHLRAELDATPIFKAHPYGNLYYGALDDQIRDCLWAARRFREGLRSVGIGSGDVLLILVARPAEVLGVAFWSWTRRTLPAAVAMNFMMDDLATHTARRLVALLYRVGTLLARLRLGDALLLTSDTPELTAVMTKVVCAEVMAFPLIRSYPPLDTRADRSPPTIAFLGGPRPEKGGGLLAAVVQACASAHAEARVVVQVPDDPVLTPAGGWRPNVQTLPVGLDQARYFELLNRADIVVLPYERRAYGRRSSGVFAEAVGCGAVTVVPAQTWMAEMLISGRGAGVTFEDFTVEAIVQAIGLAIAELGPLRDRALAIRESWRAEHSVSAFVDRLLSELRGRARLSNIGPLQRRPTRRQGFDPGPPRWVAQHGRARRLEGRRH